LCVDMPLPPNIDTMNVTKLLPQLPVPE